MKILVVTLALFLLVSASAFAVDPLGDPNPGSEMGKWWKDSEVVTQLKLTQSQVEQIEQIFLNYRPMLVNLNSELKKNEAELTTGMGTDPIDQSQVRTMTEIVAASRAELEKANSSMMIAIRQKLSKEQWNKLQAIRELRRSSIYVSIPGKPTKRMSESGETIYRAGGPVKPPRAVYQPMPPYTQEARDAKVEGIILLQGIIRKNGRITDLKVLRGLGSGLDQSAINKITNEWRFEPGTLEGQPVDVEANIEVSFRFF